MRERLVKYFDEKQQKIFQANGSKRLFFKPLKVQWLNLYNFGTIHSMPNSAEKQIMEEAQNKEQGKQKPQDDPIKRKSKIGDCVSVVVQKIGEFINSLFELAVVLFIVGAISFKTFTYLTETRPQLFIDQKTAFLVTSAANGFCGCQHIFDIGKLSSDLQDHRFNKCIAGNEDFETFKNYDTYLIDQIENAVAREKHITELYFIQIRYCYRQYFEIKCQEMCNSFFAKYY